MELHCAFINIYITLIYIKYYLILMYTIRAYVSDRLATLFIKMARYNAGNASQGLAEESRSHTSADQILGPSCC